MGHTIVHRDGNGQAVLPGTTAPAPVELKISVDVPGERKTEGSVTVVDVGASGSVDECVVEKVNSRGAVGGITAASGDINSMLAGICSSDFKVVPQASCSADGQDSVAIMGSQISQMMIARLWKNLNRLDWAEK